VKPKSAGWREFPIREYDMTKSFASVSTNAANRNSDQTINPSTMLLDPWVHATAVSARMASAWSDEAVRFASLRLSRNRDAAEQFAKCGSWREIMDLQMNWASGLMQDYLSESHQLLEIAQKTSIVPMTSAEEQAAEQRGNHKRAA
jgi:hypothetical protein